MKQKSFEEKIAHTQALLEKLMDPELNLEEALKLYAEGMEEIKEAQKMLEKAKLQIETIERTYLKGEDG